MRPISSFWRRGACPKPTWAAPCSWGRCAFWAPSWWTRCRCPRWWCRPWAASSTWLLSSWGRLNIGYEHQPLIQAYLHYHSFDGRQAFRLTRWLYAQVATSTVRPSVLFDVATAHLVAQRVVLPGVTVLARLIARVRERTGRHLYR